MKREPGKVRFTQPISQEALPEKQLGRLTRNTAVPTVENVEVWQAENVAPFNVTYLTGGATSQRVHIIGDGNTTFVYDVAKIITNTGANKLLNVNKVYSFTLVNEVWIEDVDDGGGGGGPGPAGPTGPRGPQGTSVPFIRDGKDGRDGFPIPGDRGPQGIQGIQGSRGNDGAPIPVRDGVAGRDGFSIKGDKGNKGDLGQVILPRDGRDGRDGFPIQGNSGINGTNGINGTIGRDGFSGRDGVNGRDGFSIPGPRGLKGDPGPMMFARDGKDGRDSFIPGPKGDTGAAGVGGGGGLTLTTVEINIGTLINRTSGKFQITGLAGLTVGKPVLIQQASGPYTGKGTLEDEAGMDSLIVVGKVLSATTIQCYWNSQYPVVGNFKFNYMVSA